MAKKRAARKTTPEKTPKTQDTDANDASDERADAVAHAFARLHVWQIQAVRDVLFVAAVFGIFWAGYALRAVTVPLLVALLLAYLFEPLIEKLCRHPKVSRPTAVGGLLAAIGVVLVVVIVLLTPVVTIQARQFMQDVREGTMAKRIDAAQDYAQSKLQALLELVPGRDDAAEADAKEEGGAGKDQGPAGGASAGDASGEAGVAGETGEAGPSPSTDVAATGQPSVADEPITEARARALVDERVAAQIARLRRELAAPAPPSDGAAGWLDFDKKAVALGSVDAIARVVGAIVKVGLLTFLIPFYFFFFSLWYAEVVRFGRQLIPEKNRARSLELLDKMDRVVAGFVRGRIVISIIMGVMLAIGWMICGVPYAVILGLVVGVFCAVPYLGVIGIPMAVGLLLFDQFSLPEPQRMAMWAVIVGPTVVFALVQVVEGYVLTPAIAGKATNLDPVTILVAVLAGGSVLGVYGMLLAIPLAACGKILFTDVLLPRIKAWTRGEARDPLPIERE